MSNRPAPRRSALAGASPITTPPLTATPATEVTTSGNATNAGESGKSAKGGNASVATTGSFAKISVRLPEDLAGRARAAFWSTAHLTGTKSLSEWVSQAIAAQLAVDEQTYNDGEPFTPIEPGEIPTGRRS